MRTHAYLVGIEWTGNLGSGTSAYTRYSRDHVISAPGKPVVDCSSDPTFRGDPSRYSPEELLVASLSSCHMLWYLHLCADAGISVLRYVDYARGEMEEGPDGGGRFTEVVLSPSVEIGLGGNTDLAGSLHERAHALCFIANSVNFPVSCEATITVAAALARPSA